MAEFLDVDIPEPNPAITALLVSARMRAIMEERANTAQMLYQAQVAKRTGRLARSARAHTEIGGKRNDRWIGELIIGGGIDYGAAHEFGADVVDFAGETHQDANPAHHDLNQVLQMLEAY